MDRMTPLEWTRLAHVARGFGPDGRMTLFEYIELRLDQRLASYKLSEAIDRVGHTLDRYIGPPPPP